MAIQFVKFAVGKKDTYIKCNYNFDSSKLKVDNSHLSPSGNFTGASSIDTGNKGSLKGYITTKTTALTGTLTVSIGGTSITPGGGTFTISGCQGYQN